MIGMPDTAAITASRQPAGFVSIGFVGAAAYAFLPRLAKAFNDRLPWLTVRFQEAMSLAQLQFLSLDRLDIGLMRPVEGVEAFEKMSVLREPLVAAIPITHKLAQRRRIDLKLFDNEPFIMFSPESPYSRALLNGLFREAGIRPRFVQEFVQSQPIVSLVSAGLGLAIVPAGIANASFDNVVFRPLRFEPLRGTEPRFDIVAVWQTQSSNPARTAVIEVMRELAADEPRRGFV
ncbi:hypothetical protein GCM10011491_08290 [Brucella endophytica]|uniref:LysR substrate-binding domain-containing protein n=1 Tax=Brucella endophytica TaxID=1963359 RepID=A0A916S6L4_9HYPH|nr:LysR family substrate-binding domain-containing protein [Brucella endophytica]GGA83193.1 hypothetical protein GCM10011491_08290 [Brucella endophytica]